MSEPTDDQLRESGNGEDKRRSPFSGRILSTRAAALLSIVSTGFLLAIGKWLANGPLLGLLEGIHPLGAWPTGIELCDDIWNWLCGTVLSGLIRLLLWIFALEGWCMFLIGALIALLLLVIWKYGSAALKWYYEHPVCAIFAALFLLTVLLIIVLILDFFGVTVPPAEGPLILLTIFLFLLWLLAVILLLLALISFLARICEELRKCTKRVCLVWVPVWERGCAAWEQECLAWETQRKQKCLQEETTTKQECDAWEAASDVQCSSLTGWRKWLCEAKTLAGSLLCRSWSWVTTTWCRVWTWITVTVCKLFGWVCKAWVWTWKKLICALWG